MLKARICRRFFCGTSPLRQKTVIPGVILDELNDTSRLPTSSRSKQIFLNHKQTADKRFSKYVNDIKLADKMPTNTLPVSLFFNDENPSLSLNNFKPECSKISQNKYTQLKKNIETSFTKSQLTKYLKSQYHGPVAFSRAKKSKLVGIIMDNVWNLSVSETISMDDLLVKRSVKLSKADLFLLLSQNGFVIQYLSRVGAKISFDSEKGIQFVGTESQVNSAEIMLNNILSSAKRETLDLGTIKNLFVEKYNEFSLSEVGKNTEVYFNRLHDENYELTTLNENQIKRSKRLLIWLLNYNLHTKDHLFLTSSSTGPEVRADFVPYKDDISLSWNQRHHNLWKLKSASNDAKKSDLYLNDLKRFSDEKLQSTDIEYEHIVEDAKSVATQALEDENWSLLQGLGIVAKEPEPECKQTEQEITDAESADIKTATGFSSEEIDAMYAKLSDFGYRKDLDGEQDSKLLSPIMTVTFGDLLFEGESKDKSIITQKPQLSGDSQFQFSTNLPLIVDKVLSLPLSDIPELTVKDKNRFMSWDPHNYLVQLKFLPSPYDKKDVGNIKYPPVEIWMNLNSRSVPYIDSMSVVTVEGENNVYVPLPNSKSDLKICSQLTGNVLESSDEPTEEHHDVDTGIEDATVPLEDILKSTERYSRFNLQPGIVEFLKRSTLDFSGYRASSIEPFIDLNINGKVVRYQYINVSSRRQLEFNYRDRGIEVNIVEGGQLGGRRIEVNLIGVSGDTSKEQLILLLADARKLVNEL